MRVTCGTKRNLLASFVSVRASQHCVRGLLDEPLLLLLLLLLVATVGRFCCCCCLLSLLAGRASRWCRPRDWRCSSSRAEGAPRPCSRASRSGGQGGPPGARLLHCSPNGCQSPGKPRAQLGGLCTPATSGQTLAAECSGERLLGLQRPRLPSRASLASWPLGLRASSWPTLTRHRAAETSLRNFLLSSAASDAIAIALARTSNEFEPVLIWSTQLAVSGTAARFCCCCAAAAATAVALAAGDVAQLCALIADTRLWCCATEEMNATS